MGKINDIEGVETFVVRGVEYDNTSDKDEAINQGDLSGDFVEHPLKFAKWATLYELALDAEIRLKNELARRYAQVDHLVRMEAINTKTKLTEKMVENTVITHPKYLELQEKYLDAKRTTGLLRAAKDAMIHRKDMLVQLGANYRAEGASDISIKEQTVRTTIGRK